MGLPLKRYKSLLLALICLPVATAQAQVPPLEPVNMTARYDASVGVLPLGHMFATVHETPLHYDMELNTKSQGLVDMIAPMKSIARVSGHRSEDGDYLANDYTALDSKEDSKNDKSVHLQYDGDGKLAERERHPEDDPAWRPAVPREKAENAPDPMTGFFRHRKILHDMMARNVRDASIVTYDGARLARLNFHVVSRARIQVMGKDVDAINTMLTRQPMDGYTPKELRKFAAGDPPIHVYFSADGRFLPLMAGIELPYGEVKIVLSKYEEMK